MKVTFIASATTVIEYNGFRVLTDPWLTGSVFYGAWRHSPPLTVTPEDFHDVDAIYISHIHHDHCDLETLKRLNKRTPVYIAPYADDFLRTMLAGRGYTVHVLRHGEPVTLAADFTLEIVAADSCDPEACGRWMGCNIRDALHGVSHQIDSLAVFRGGGRTIVNTNDCPYLLAKPALERIAAQGPVDLAMTSYSGASAYPHCFPQYDTETMVRLGLAKRDKVIGMAHAIVAELKARYWLPFAGQYTLAGPLAHLNDLRGVPELEELPPHPAMIRLNRGESFDVATGTQSAPFVPRDMLEVRARAARMSEYKLAHESDPMPDEADLRDLLSQAWGKWLDRLKERRVDLDWSISVHAGTFGSILWVAASNKTLAVNVDPRLLRRLLTRKAHWNAAEVGSLLTFRREPDVYERTPYLALSYLHV